jgi:ABC-type uncharacterized transport system fused permease/ATPase subunit
MRGSSGACTRSRNRIGCGKGRSWIVLIVLLGVAASFNVFGAYFSFLTRDQTNALVARKALEFWYFLTLSRTYYEIANDQLIDNPDQRISEEVRPFCNVITGIPFQLITMVTDITVQAGILMGISKPLFAAVAAFAAIKTVLILWLYKPTIKQHYDITVSEADLRYGILHVRDNAETIAFYRGEFAERGQILERLRTAIRRNLIQISYNVRLTFVRDILGMGWTLIPLLFLTPMYFAREIEYGTIAQATGCRPRCCHRFPWS